MRENTTSTSLAVGRTRGGEATAGRILDAALAVFAAEGFSGARVDAIAAAAGISKTNLLYYFRTKRELYLAVLRRTLDMWLEPLKLMQPGNHPPAAIKAYVTRKLEYARDYPEASRLFAMEIMRGAPILDQVLQTDLKVLVDQKAELLQVWMGTGRLRWREPRHFLFMVWATTQHYADFAVQVEALTGKTLQDPAFFAETLEHLHLALCSE